jgi:hypothetical protein
MESYEQIQDFLMYWVLGKRYSWEQHTRDVERIRSLLDKAVFAESRAANWVASGALTSKDAIWTLDNGPEKQRLNDIVDKLLQSATSHTGIANASTASYSDFATDYTKKRLLIQAQINEQQMYYRRFSPAIENMFMETLECIVTHGTEGAAAFIRDAIRYNNFDRHTMCKLLRRLDATHNVFCLVTGKLYLEAITLAQGTSYANRKSNDIYKARIAAMETLLEFFSRNVNVGVIHKAMETQSEKIEWHQLNEIKAIEFNKIDRDCTDIDAEHIEPRTTVLPTMYTVDVPSLMFCFHLSGENHYSMKRPKPKDKEDIVQKPHVVNCVSVGVDTSDPPPQDTDHVVHERDVIVTVQVDHPTTIVRREIMHMPVSEADAMLSESSSDSDADDTVGGIPAVPLAMNMHIDVKPETQAETQAETQVDIVNTLISPVSVSSAIEEPPVQQTDVRQSDCFNRLRQRIRRQVGS